MLLRPRRIDRAALHGTIRKQFVTKLQAALKGSGSDPAAGVVLVQGGEPFHVNSTDGELLFKQVLPAP